MVTLFLLVPKIILKSYSGDEELCCVYVPTNHHYIGDVFLVNTKDVIRPNLSIWEGTEVLGDYEDVVEVESDAVVSEAEYDGLQGEYQETRKDVNALGPEDHDHVLLLGVVVSSWS
ncbi:hypothetical protein EV2_024148 [Malus domestica]